MRNKVEKISDIGTYYQIKHTQVTSTECDAVVMQNQKILSKAIPNQVCCCKSYGYFGLYGS